MRHSIRQSLAWSGNTAIAGTEFGIDLLRQIRHSLKDKNKTYLVNKLVEHLKTKYEYAGHTLPKQLKKLLGLKEGSDPGDYEDLASIVGSPSPKDRQYYKLHASEPMTAEAALAKYTNINSAKVLEIGSRNAGGNGFRWEGLVDRKNYVGFDIHPGENVDIVGDAHRLSEYFEEETFDAIVCMAVFEHLAMPWIVAEEITKALKPNGLVLIFTHFSYGEHSLPWHFFQFNTKGLETLFNSKLGFEVITSYKKFPMVGRFGFDCPGHLKGKPIQGLYCSSHIIARKINQTKEYKWDSSFDWRSCLDTVYGPTQYPI